MASNGLRIERAADQFEEEIREAIAEEYRAVAFEFFARVVQGTPVDTGRARANWGLVDSVPDANEDSPVVHVTEGKIEVIYLYNNLPYIVELEMGSSKQAPAGFIRLAAAELGLSYSGSLEG